MGRRVRRVIKGKLKAESRNWMMETTNYERIGAWDVDGLFC
jgi:hypothetical protein